MMGIGRRTLTDQAGLRSDECEMGLVAASHRPAQRCHHVFGVGPWVLGGRCSGHRGGITISSIRLTNRRWLGWTLNLICTEIQRAEYDLAGGLDGACIVGRE